MFQLYECVLACVCTVSPCELYLCVQRVNCISVYSMCTVSLCVPYFCVQCVYCISMYSVGLIVSDRAKLCESHCPKRRDSHPGGSHFTDVLVQ